MDPDTNRPDIVAACRSSHQLDTCDSHFRSACSSRGKCTLPVHRRWCVSLQNWWRHARTVAIHRNQYLKRSKNSIISDRLQPQLHTIQLTFACWRRVAPNARFHTFACRIANKRMPHRARVFYWSACCEILTHHRCVLQRFWRSAWQWFCEQKTSVREERKIKLHCPFCKQNSSKKKKYNKQKQQEGIIIVTHHVDRWNGDNLNYNQHRSIANCDHHPAQRNFVHRYSCSVDLCPRRVSRPHRLRWIGQLHREMKCLMERRKKSNIINKKKRNEWDNSIVREFPTQSMSNLAPVAHTRSTFKVPSRF